MPRFLGLPAEGFGPTPKSTMKRYRGINYRQRPKNYWEASGGLRALLRNLKGKERRAMIRQFWREGRIQELELALLKPKLSKREREEIGRIHPSYLGGEYLPPYKSGEVEIARIELDSSTADVISIRARPGRQGIAYRIVDEYRTRFRLPRASSREPLTLAELVSLIENTEIPGEGRNLALHFNERNAQDGDKQDWEGFTEVTSDFYPKLGTHFDNIFREWAKGEG